MLIAINIMVLLVSIMVTMLMIVINMMVLMMIMMVTIEMSLLICPIRQAWSPVFAASYTPANHASHQHMRPKS